LNSASRITRASALLAFGISVLLLLIVVRPAVGDSDLPGLYRNPVWSKNFPDPGVLLVDGTYYAYATNGPSGNAPLITSTDLVHWTERGDALPTIGAWAVSGWTWAPEVIAVDGGYVLYYTARSALVGRECVGTAVAPSPLGPFRDLSPVPLVCQGEEGGSMDASPFRDRDGSLYLLWKNDGNAIGVHAHIYAQRLRADGLGLTGTAVRLLTNHAPWQAAVVEAPQMYRRGDVYYLFYSGNNYGTDRAAIGYALCSGPMGPCTDSARPILASDSDAAGPAHCSVVVGPDGGTWMIYHAWPPDAVGASRPGRTMRLDRIRWIAGRPTVLGPTTSPQLRPSRVG
jgi:beta-xylosidase